MLGTQIGGSVYLRVHMCLSGITLLPFSRFLCVFLCIQVLALTAHNNAC